jgi:predicted Zn finger-like uncharacterized protein
VNEEKARVDAVCPSCRQQIRIHRESVAIGAEVLCPECGALLGVDRRDPLSLIEIDPDDL